MQIISIFRILADAIGLGRLPRFQFPRISIGLLSKSLKNSGERAYLFIHLARDYLTSLWAEANVAPRAPT